MTKSIPSMLLAGAFLLGASHQAKASVDIGSDSVLFFTANVSAAYTDNLFLSSANKSNDSILTASPGAMLTFGNEAMAHGSLAVSEDFQYFYNKNDLNTTLDNLDFLTRYDDGKMKLNLDANYHQLDQATRDVRGPSLVKRAITHGGLMDEASLTEKTALGIGIAYDKTAYRRAGYVGWRSYSVPLNVYYKYDTNLDLLAGIKYRTNKLGTGGVNSRDFYYNIGARGDIAPKLSGLVTAGYIRRTFTGLTSKSDVGLEANLTYAYSEKTTIFFGANNSFNNSALGGGGYKEFGLNTGFQADISGDLKINGQINYNKYYYVGVHQTDEFYSGQLSGTYMLNAYVTLTAGYAYSKNKSNVVGNGFTSNMFQVSAAVKY